MPETLALTPDATGYKATYPNEIVSSGPLDGGSDLRRLDVIGATGLVSVQWTCDPMAFNYLRAFYRTTITRGVDWFYCNLMLDSFTVEPFLCAIVPGSCNLDSNTGYVNKVTATLEFIPNPVDADSDVSVVLAYTIDASLANALANVVNVILPTVGD